MPADALVCKASCNDIRCGLVVVQWSDAAVTTELIPYCQIRRVPSPEDLQERRVGPDCFVSRECRLPRGYWSAPPGATRMLWQKFSREFNACCIAVRSEFHILPAPRLTGVFTRPIADCECEGSPEGEWDGYRFVPTLKRVKAPRTEVSQAGRGIPLPREILAEIFQSLDTIERVRKRRVCCFWDAVLLLDADVGASGKQLWISGRHSFHVAHTEQGEQFLLAGCVLKYATPATNTIILEELSELACWSRDMYGLLAILLQDRRIRTLVLSRCDFCDHYSDAHDYLDWVNGKLSRLAATCRVVVWQDCQLTLRQTTAQVARAQFCLHNDPAHRLAQLWDAYERSLVGSVELPRLAEWVARCVSTHNSEACDYILWVLLEYSSADPRTDQQSAKKKWTMDNLNKLDVYKLTKLAQFALNSRVHDR
ncbi:uncharacterized protein LOC129587113 isoform X1 [Paramacrobiotus metropolitanus]|uniref:uncharacterized protein LOC129587113 isoform X1 n=1 Tax=Paramacrobiotus metropolitanus TaxID=2943436 RepID=UPI00244580DA|nr:uncharacterized protein LOC129587113 isoform X1 [Paramacrobiotus metropolitanus]